MRQADETAHKLLRFAKKCMGLSTAQRVRAQICREDIAALDQYERFAFPLGVSRIQPQRLSRRLPSRSLHRSDLMNGGLRLRYLADLNPTRSPALRWTEPVDDGTV